MRRAFWMFRSKRWFQESILAALLMGAWVASASATDVGGTIGTQTWTLGGSPYHVTSDLTLTAGSTLTIQPGVVVKLDIARTMTIQGTLTAIGTPAAADTIVFTSWRDDLHGGVNPDPIGPGRGDWVRIRFTGAGTNSSVMKNCLVVYGGASGNAQIACDNQATPTIRESQIALGGSSGISSSDAGPRIWANGIHDNSSYAVRVSGSTDITWRNPGEPALPEDTFANNGATSVPGNAVGVDAGTTAGAWRKPGAVGGPKVGYPYVVIGSVSVVNTTLGLDPGLAVKMSAGTYFRVDGGNNVPTTVTAVGTATDSIVFTALTDDGYGGDTNNDQNATGPSRGYWDRIQVEGNDADATVFKYCVVRYGGSGGVGGIYCFDRNGTPRPTFRECRIEGSSGPGIFSANGGPRIYDSRIQWNASYAVQIDAFGDVQWRNPSEPGLPEDVFANNGATSVPGNAVGVNGGNVAGAWRKPGAVGGPKVGYPYVVIASVSVVNTTLGLDPGLAVKMSPTTYFRVDGGNDVPTTVTAVGTATDSIVFTALTDDGYGGDTNNDQNATGPSRGYWSRIQVEGNDADATVFKYCVVRYGGSGGVGGIYCFDRNGTPRPTFRECRIEGSSGPGIFSVNGGPRIYDSLIQWNASYAVQIDAFGDVQWRNPSEPGLPEDVFANNGATSVPGNAVGVNGGNVAGAWRKPGAVGGPKVGYPYVVIASVSVVNTTLGLDPGLAVKMSPTTYFRVDGGNDVPTTVTAVGTATDSIVFTALTDDGYGGDTNNDQNATGPSRGYWSRIQVEGNDADATVFKYCVVRYGGSGGVGGIYCFDRNGTPRPTLRECRIEGSSGPGIFSVNGGPRIYDSRIQWNASYAVQIDAFSDVQWRNPSEPGLPEDVFANNGATSVPGNAVGVDAGNVAGAWRKPGAVGGPKVGYPYVVIGSVSVVNTTLGLDPGLAVKMSAGTYFRVDGGNNVPTTVTAVGTATDSIVFTALTDDGYGGDTNNDQNATGPSRGYWDRIQVEGNDADATVFKYCVVRYGGSGGVGGIYCFDRNGTPRPTFRECRIEGSSGPGIFSANGGPRIYDSRIQWNQGYAVQIEAYSDLQWRNPSEPSLPEDVFNSNNLDAVKVGNSANVHGAWRRPPSGLFPYHVPSSVSVGNGQIMAVDSGTIIKMSPNAELLAAGTLVMNGTCASPIIMTSIRDDVGDDTNNDATPPDTSDWLRLHLQGAGATSSVINGVIFKYGGGPGGTSGRGQLWCENTGSAAAPNVSVAGCRFHVGKSPGGLYASGSNVLASSNDFLGPQCMLALVNATSTIQLNATNCFWNQPSGPCIVSNPSGTGTGVSSFVTYLPFNGGSPCSDPIVSVHPEALSGAADSDGSPLPATTGATLTVGNLGLSDLLYQITEGVGAEANSGWADAPWLDPSQVQTTDVAWLSENPTNGRVAPGGSQSVAVGMTATGLSDARHAAYLLFGTNDPARSSVVVPVSFYVGHAYVGVEHEPEPELPSRASFEGIRPSPARAAVVFALQMPPGTRGQLIILDVSGRRIETLQLDPGPGGRVRLNWGCTDHDGHPVASGVYFARLDTSQGTGLKRFLVVR